MAGNPFFGGPTPGPKPKPAPEPDGPREVVVDLTLHCKTCQKPIGRSTVNGEWVHKDDHIVLGAGQIKTVYADHDAEPDVIDVYPKEIR